MRSSDSIRSSSIRLASFALTLLLSPNFSFAQPTTNSPEHLPTRVEKGEPAPFTGTLVTVDHAIRLAQKASGCAERTAIEISRAVRLVEIDVKLCKKYSAIDADAAVDRQAHMQRQLDDALVWYRDPIFVAATTAVLTAAVIMLARETVIER